ncbi:hypothetical protein DFH08DRAFT_816966 [Mycena albidolilacea]|uniref:Reverse transcriptase domain-containing protein n=1 Tax=Mycena albidolilacea TaxID=1033008 RepID=A0AAD6ZJY6_9AGAR|nr:hypothetical protein DFH08DRAFT_816966 [Mycena albidolilacea]
MCKPGKPDYLQVGAHHTLILSHRHVHFRNGGKTLQLATNVEHYNMLPDNHYRGRPGRTGVDIVQGIAQKVKDAWRQSKVATLLLRDVKGAFPGAMILMPREHTDWIQRRFEGCKTCLVVNFRRLGKVVGGVHVAWIRQLYFAICVPRMLYRAELKAGQLMLGAMALSPGNLVNAQANLLTMLLVIDKFLQKATTCYATMPKTHPLHATVCNATHYRHVKKHLSPLHFLMNTYTNVKQGVVEVILAARRRAGWKAPVDVCVAEMRDEAKKWVEEETSKGCGQGGEAGEGDAVGHGRAVRGVPDRGVGMVLALECLRLKWDKDIEGTIP